MCCFCDTTADASESYHSSNNSSKDSSILDLLPAHPVREPTQLIVLKNFRENQRLTSKLPAAFTTGRRISFAENLETRDHGSGSGNGNENGNGNADGSMNENGNMKGDEDGNVKGIASVKGDANVKEDSNMKGDSNVKGDANVDGDGDKKRKLGPGASGRRWFERGQK
ncbi:hypothetical protein MMC14_000980 [Varicellaria rhodocarpa]|nr:hypothetical protein [Varicellaria rhodocarpa]